VPVAAAVLFEVLWSCVEDYLACRKYIFELVREACIYVCYQRLAAFEEL